jgi:uncharacterized repeat protein (TIGR02543 family)
MTAVLDQDSGKYFLKNGDAVVCDSVTAVTNKVKFTTVIGDVINTVLITKGQTKSLDDAVPPEGYRFGGWYLDSEYNTEYDSTVELTDNTTVYAKFISLSCTVNIIGDGIVVKSGDDVIESGSIVQCGTTLDLIIEERIGYSCLVKVDGVVVTGSTITVPANDFVISCEWNEISYSVECVDGTAVVAVIDKCHLGDVVTLPVVDKAGFTGWSVGNGMLLGAQYIVNYRDAENDTITLKASFTELQDTAWELTVTGGDGKAFWTKSNAIGSYGIVTVLPAEFEKASVSIDPAVDGAYVGKLSDNTYMVFSANGEDVTVSVVFQSVEKASEYTVSMVEIVKDGVPGFRATVAATDGGIVDTSANFAIRYVYKEKTDSGLWCYTTSGQTDGVKDYVIDLGGANANAYFVSGEFLLGVEGAYLVYGYATYSFGDASSAAGITIETSPVIMSVSEIQAVIRS